jgi:hypothetical protein
MRTVPLRDAEGTPVAFALVDDKDYDRINRHCWSLMAGVARRNVKAGGRSRSMLMHREVIGATFGDGLRVEHANGNRLDNRRANLRVRPAVPASRHSLTPHARARLAP